MGWMTKIYQRYNGDSLRISFKKVLLMALCFFGLLYYVSESELGKNLEIRTARKLQFHVRDALGMNPPVAKNLKILMYDDKTVDYMIKNFNQSNGVTIDLNVASWGAVYEHLASRKPKFIFTDKLFSAPDGTLEARSRFTEKMKKISAPIAAAAFSQRHESELSVDRELDYSHPNYKYSEWTNGKPLNLNSKVQDGLRVFGPHKTIQAGFTFIGHIRLDGQNGDAPAFLRPNAETMIPHWSFYLAEHRSVDDSNVYLDGHRLPLDDNGNFIVNLVPREHIEKNIISFNSVLDNMFNKKPTEDIMPNDVVLILFNHTGANDWFETFFGSMEGGILNATITNSILTGQFIEKVNDKKMFLLLATLAGGLLASLFSFRYSIFISISFLIGLPVLAFSAFSFLGVELSWIYPIMGFTLANGAVSYDRYRISEKRSDRIRNALSGMISEDKLEQLIRSPENLDIKPSSREVTIMFVDMVGFSIVAERTAPEEAFTLLKNTMQEITRLIHNYGGVIDRTLGDGVLCFFGYHYDGSEIMGSHATQAIDCAVHIQRHILERNLVAHTHRQPNFPLRIGINTDRVFIGDMGDERRLDYTLIGDGVNFAQRLETSCESYHVLISENSRSKYEQLDQESMQINEKFVLIKHHNELIKTFEINPFVKDKEQFYKAIQAHRIYAGLEREHERIPALGENKIQMVTQFDEGHLVNFSPAGFGIWLPRYIGKGVDLELRLKQSVLNSVEKSLSDQGFFPLFAEVRWAKPHDGGFIHGLALHNLSQARQQKLYQILLTPLSQKAKRA